MTSRQSPPISSTSAIRRRTASTRSSRADTPGSNASCGCRVRRRCDRGTSRLRETAVKTRSGWSSCSWATTSTMVSPVPMSRTEDASRARAASVSVHGSGTNRSPSCSRSGSRTRRRVAQREHDHVRLEGPAVGGDDPRAPVVTARPRPGRGSGTASSPPGPASPASVSARYVAVPPAGQEGLRLGRRPAPRAPAQQVVGVPVHRAEPLGEVVEGVPGVRGAVGAGPARCPRSFSTMVTATGRAGVASSSSRTAATTAAAPPPTIVTRSAEGSLVVWSRTCALLRPGRRRDVTGTMSARLDRALRMCVYDVYQVSRNYQF